MEVADVLLHFWDVDRGGLFTTPDDGEALVVRQKDLMDNATPSANSPRPRWRCTDSPRSPASPLLQPRRPDHPPARARGALSRPPPSPRPRRGRHAPRRAATEIVITGDRPDLLAEVRRHWLPDAVLAWGEPYDSPLWQPAAPTTSPSSARTSVCQLPVGTVEHSSRNSQQLTRSS
jgi:uncharacterized protein YyaL (SSP411 family)